MNGYDSFRNQLQKMIQERRSSDYLNQKQQKSIAKTSINTIVNQEILQEQEEKERDIRIRLEEELKLSALHNLEYSQDRKNRLKSQEDIEKQNFRDRFRKVQTELS